MPSRPHPFLLGARLKVERAYSHIDQLRTMIDPLDAGFFEIQVKARPLGLNVDRTELKLIYEPTKPIPESLALIIGDSVHNFRAALDHLCTAIVRTVDPSAEVHFPMHRLRKDFNTAPVLTLIEKALPGAKKLILDEIRPDNGPNDAIWRFNKLDNDDKHNLLIPVVTVASVGGFRVLDRNSNVFDIGGIGNDAAHPFVLVTSDSPFAIEGNFEVTVDITFPKGAPFEGQSVLVLLSQVGHIVTETINSFERLLAAQP